jgi:protein phosphatase PTC7
MKSTMNMIRSATTSAFRQQTTSNLATKCCRRPPSGKVGEPIRRLSKTKKAAGAFLLAAPSFLVTPAESMIYDDETIDTQTTSNLTSSTLSIKSTLTSTTSNLLASPESLKDSFDAFLQSIEPLICDTRLSVGISSIPHPAKVAKGGEDAYFLSDDMKIIGVADGVGGWGDIGVDPALYSKSLMEGAKLSVESSPSIRDPVEIMSEAYQYSSYVQGSSTCCVLTLEGIHLHAANLGDSGFMVLRGLEIVYRTKEQQHSFNFPYQIGTGSADKPQHAQRITVEVQPGDLIIVGTDGLWDNLFDEDILEVVANAGTNDPATIGQHIARQAHIVANDKDILSPFSKSARSNGYPLATGGKLDDITVLVGRVVLSCVDYGDLNNGVEPMTLAA